MIENNPSNVSSAFEMLLEEVEAEMERFGTMTLAQVLQPAIEYAERGFPVTDVIAYDWKLVQMLPDDTDFARTFKPKVSHPAPERSSPTRIWLRRSRRSPPAGATFSTRGRLQKR